MREMGPRGVRGRGRASAREERHESQGKGDRGRSANKHFPFLPRDGARGARRRASDGTPRASNVNSRGDGGPGVRHFLFRLLLVAGAL